MKIAFATDDEQGISAHFGKAKYFKVFTLADGQVIDQESRHKPAKGAMVAIDQIEQSTPDQIPQQHGHHHGTMIEMIADCDVLIGRGMGEGAYHHLQQAEINVILTDLKTIEEALHAYQEGSIEHNPKRIHHH